MTIKNNLKCSGIYVITNIVNNKYYGGSSVNINKRWNQHKWLAKTGSTKCTKLYAAIRKYGVQNFAITVFKEVNPDVLLMEEQLWLDEFYSESLSYNISLTAESPMRKRHHSEETKKKMSKARKGKVSSMKGKNNEGKRLSMLGVPRSELTKQKISTANKGQIPWCKGLKIGARSDVVRSNISRSHRKFQEYPVVCFPDGSEEHIENLSKFCRDHSLSCGNMQQV